MHDFEKETSDSVSAPSPAFRHRMVFFVDKVKVWKWNLKGQVAWVRVTGAWAVCCGGACAGTMLWPRPPLSDLPRCGMWSQGVGNSDVLQPCKAGAAKSLCWATLPYPSLCEWTNDCLFWRSHPLLLVSPLHELPSPFHPFQSWPPHHSPNP